MTDTTEWEERVARHWSLLNDLEPEAFRRRMATLVDELPEGDPRGLFERGCAHDSTGQPDQAIPLYRAALDAGLSGLDRRRANIQMASSLRILGRPAEAAKRLSAEAQWGEDELSTAVEAFHALVLSDLGHDREALSLALTALSKHLPRYNASLGRYALALVENKVKNERLDL